MKYAVLLLAACLFSCSEGEKIAEIKMERDTINFNTIPQGKVILIPFKYKNVGNTELKIKKLDSSCPCIKIVSTGNNILPDETGEIWISYDSSQDSAQVEQSVVIETNTKTVLHTLTLKGVVSRK
ncbi:DUF1573 domain-containing protein [Emticicia sp. TH156]|uniref:DUF1573 domain-containing protein n=1 Tax=Emticicia sp. TH156 TaxID=2067454 RepID=UPI000C78862E|nr:DUF1573 domain-containing protein [Emticicia sp. TH156]PLK44756.1 hypothetical protein C0V77_09920 [Emticicia sp. TH156]